MKRKKLYILSAIIIVIVLVSVGGYSFWNNADPQKTCVQCHEIEASHQKWTTSAHADVQCIDCHGKALSSFRSFKEKTGMVIAHFTSAPRRNEDIKLSEQQVLDITQNCAICHTSEHAQWAASGHSATYADIFEDQVHNAAEKPYSDCLRCHGMFYEGQVSDMMDLSGNDPAKWAIKDRAKSQDYTVPCLACHQMHTPNPTSVRPEKLNAPREVHYARAEQNPKTALYLRNDKVRLRTDKLTPVTMIDSSGNKIKMANDPSTLLCVQCHAPNAVHKAGSMDDRTPTGVHEGLSCAACHKGHSMDTRSSCAECHPGMSNCGIDVAQMNTTFKDPKSPNDIHKVSCTDCHDKRPTNTL